MNSASSSFTNSATGNIAITNAGNGVNVYSSSQTVTNNGVISGSGTAVWGVYVIASGATITNSNSISVSGNSAIGIYNRSSTSSITNTGSISATGTSAYGISNTSTIATLNNSQADLTYTGRLPTNYNIIVNSASSFGALSATSVTGSTTFGITSSTLAAGTYSSVLSGLTSSNIVSSSLTGTYTGGYSYSLVNSGGTSWNLVVTCPSCNTTPTSSGGDGSSSSSTPSNSATNTLSGSTSTISGYTSSVVVNTGAVTTGSSLTGTVTTAPSTTAVVIPSGTVVTGNTAVTNYGTTAGIANAGIVAGTDYGVYNAPDATIQVLANNGIISGGVAGIANLSPHTIDLLVNTGTILGGIDNTQGRIITLVNSQGGTIPLALSGNLPNNYQVIVNGLRSYGQLAVNKAAGQMRFGIAPGSVVYSGLTYTSVLTGVGANNLLNTAGSGGGYLFKLTPETSGTVWNMTIGASVVDTQSSLQSTTSALQNQYAAQSNGVIAGLTYDCSLFGENGICVSAGGRETGSSSFINGTTSALLIGAYKVNDKIRVGAYLDQTSQHQTLTALLVIAIALQWVAYSLFGMIGMMA